MDTDTQLVDKDGRFVLEAGETVTFSDQFRRGSYISLKEDLNAKPVRHHMDGVRERAGG